MPITGKQLYPFRWWYRAHVDNSASVQTFESDATWVTLVPPKTLPTTVPVGSQPLAVQSANAGKEQ